MCSSCTIYKEGLFSFPKVKETEALTAAKLEPWPVSPFLPVLSSVQAPLPGV